MRYKERMSQSNDVVSDKTDMITSEICFCAAGRTQTVLTWHHRLTGKQTRNTRVISFHHPRLPSVAQKPKMCTVREFCLEASSNCVTMLPLVHAAQSFTITRTHNFCLTCECVRGLLPLLSACEKLFLPCGNSAMTDIRGQWAHH